MTEAPPPSAQASEQAVQRRLDAGEAVLMFDGVCTLCNASVDFVMRHDRRDRFAFASLQSDEAQSFLAVHGKHADALLDTVVLADGDGLHEQSTAALRVLRRLGLPWSLLYGLVAVPRPLRDAVYRWVAANRYRWFGKRETCRLPTPEERERFV